MEFDMRVLQRTGSPMLANLAWFRRHPLYASCWFLTGKPWSEAFAN